MLHHVTYIRVSANRQNVAKLIKLMHHVLWLRVGAIKHFGMTNSRNRPMDRTQSGFLSIPDTNFFPIPSGLYGSDTRRSAGSAIGASRCSPERVYIPP